MQSITVTASSTLPTQHGDFLIHSFRHENECDTKEPHLALAMGLKKQTMPLVRIHSECITGDVFRSVRCDCGNQLDSALERIATRGSGLLVYLRQEGRGIGIENKLRAYHLQEKGLDTIEANIELGLPVDAREYSMAAKLLIHFDLHQCDLLTNNPEKVSALENAGIQINRTLPLLKPNDHHFCHAYMDTKRQKMGHRI